MLEWTAMLLGFFVALPSLARTQDTEVLKSRILTAVRRSKLDNPTIKTYRIEGSLTTWDGAGKNPQQGTFAILRNDKSFRISVKFSSADSVVLVTPSGTYESANGTLPYYVTPLVVNFEQGVDFQGFDSTAATRPADLPADEALECASLVETQKAVVHGPHPPKHLVCLSSADDDLRVVVDGESEFVRNDQAKMGDQRISRDVRLQVGGFTVAELRVLDMIDSAPNESEFAVAPEMKLVRGGATKVAGAMLTGKIIHHEEPKYPGVARAAHIQGVVVLHAIIGKDGHVRDLSLVSSPDKSLTEAAMKAVSKWVYEPFLLDGVPTEVDTTISVNFAIGK